MEIEGANKESIQWLNVIAVEACDKRGVDTSWFPGRNFLGLRVEVARLLLAIDYYSLFLLYLLFRIFSQRFYATTEYFVLKIDNA